MSRESKIITSSVMDAQETIQHYESFGWELLSLNGNLITMSRETQNPVYPELVKYQSQFESKLAEYAAITYPIAPQKPAPVSFKTCLIAFICLVVPCAIYVTYKVIQNNKYKEAYAEYTARLNAVNAKKQRLLSEMNEIAQESRSVFFSRHE